MPIVEPEVTLGPGSYGIEETAFWSERVYSHVFRLLNEYSVALDAILLKPNMCLPGRFLSMHVSRSFFLSIKVAWAC